MNEIRMQISSSLENLAMIRAVSNVYLEHQKVGQKDILKIISIIDELATNAVEHGYKYRSGEITVEIRKEKNVISLSIEDNGQGFDENKTSKEEGGIGLILVNKMADEVKIENKQTGTRVEVKKIVEEVEKK